MKLKKPDEMEQTHNLKAARNAFQFYMIALLAWGIYDFIKTGHLGLPFIIFVAGNAVFWGSRVIYDSKTKKRSEKPTRAVLWTAFYIILFIVIGLISYYLQKES